MRDDYNPYTYLIGWSKLDKWYYGSKTANRHGDIANPITFWRSYFTSSKYVQKIIEEHGQPDVIQVRKVFNNADDTLRWEQKVLRRIDAANKSEWINKHNGGKFTWSGKTFDNDHCDKLSKAKKGKTPWNKGKKTGRIAWNRGKTHSAETCRKLSLAHSGKTRIPTSDSTKDKISESVKKSWFKRNRHFSEDSRKRMSMSRKGKPHSIAHRLAIGRAQKERWARQRGSSYGKI